MNNELQEEQKRVQCLTVECDKSHETAQIAIKKVQVVRQELKQERERAKQLTENFLRDVTFAESRAASAEVFVCVSVILLVGSKYFLFWWNISQS